MNLAKGKKKLQYKLGLKFFAMSIFLLASVSCIKLGSNKIVAKVGDYEFTSQDVERKDKIAQIYNAQEKRKVGLFQLVKGATLAQILSNNGHKITQQTLAAEADRIEKKSLLPEKLNQIKSIFGSDLESYYRVFILPVYAERTIYYDFFLKNPAIQKESREKAVKIVSESNQTKKPMKVVAEQNGVKARRGVLDKNNKLIWDDERKINKEKEKNKESQFVDMSKKNAVPAAVQAKFDQMSESSIESFYRQILASMTPNSVLDRVVDLNEAWQVFYLEKVKKSKSTKELAEYTFEVITIPKANYEHWLTTEKAKIPIDIDPEFQQQMDLTVGH